MHRISTQPGCSPAAMGTAESLDCDLEILAGACLVQIPKSWSSVIKMRGPKPAAPADARRFRRAYCHSYAVLVQGSRCCSVIVCDVSGNGMSLLHHEQLFPGDEVEVALPLKEPIALQIARCTKRGFRCYQCGARARREVDRERLLAIVRACVAAPAP